MGSPSLTSGTGFMPPLPPAVPWERQVQPAAPAWGCSALPGWVCGIKQGIPWMPDPPLFPAVPSAPEPAGHQERVHPGLLVRRLHLDREEVPTVGAGGSAEAEPGAVRDAAPAQARHGHQEPGRHRVPGRAAVMRGAPQMGCRVPKRVLWVRYLLCLGVQVQVQELG